MEIAQEQDLNREVFKTNPLFSYLFSACVM